MMVRYLFGWIKIFILTLVGGCSAMEYNNTVDYIDIDRFMGKWFVIAGRVTFLEKGAHNPIEEYTFNADKDRIEIDFSFNKNSLSGPKKSIPQKAWIHNKKTNAHWKVSPFWPLKLDYLVILNDKDYEWTVIGVPSQRYLWLMARSKNIKQEKISEILNEVERNGYDTKNIIYFEHN